MTQPSEFTPEEMESEAFGLYIPGDENTARRVAAMLRHAARLQRERDARWRELRTRLNKAKDALTNPYLPMGALPRPDINRGEIIGLLDALILMNDIEKELS